MTFPASHQPSTPNIGETTSALASDSIRDHKAQSHNPYFEQQRRRDQVKSWPFHHTHQFDSQHLHDHYRGDKQPYQYQAWPLTMTQTNSGVQYNQGQQITAPHIRSLHSQSNTTSSMINHRHHTETISSPSGSAFATSNTIDSHYSSQAQQSEPARRNRSAAAKLARFPNLLYRLLMDADTQRFSNIVSWLPHGRAFVIRDVRSFESFVMPRYFSNSNWNSFRR